MVKTLLNLRRWLILIDYIKGMFYIPGRQNPPKSDRKYIR